MRSSCTALSVKSDFCSSMEMVTSPERVYTGKCGIWTEGQHQLAEDGPGAIMSFDK